MRWEGASVVRAVLRGGVLGLGAVLLFWVAAPWGQAGALWQVTASGSPFEGFHAVDCRSSIQCTAVGVGADGMVAGRWNGSSWSAESVPAPSGKSGWLAGVSCASSVRCVAVGSAITFAGHYESWPLAESWNGVSWSIRRTLVPSGSAEDSKLVSVSCPRSSSCIAVGYFIGSGGRYHPLAERWNGKRWSIQKVAPSKAF